MIYKTGNLLDVTGTDQFIVHGCNRQAVWGSGVARQMKEKYPLAFTRYVADIERGMGLGNCSFYKADDGTSIMSALTQESYGRDASVRYMSYDALDSALGIICMAAAKFNKIVNLPDMIGAGLGGGNYQAIQAIINDNAKKHNVPHANIVVWTYPGATI